MTAFYSQHRLKNNQGQAILELALGLILLVIVFFGLDFICALVMAKNRAEIYQHHLLFKAYRQSEKVAVQEAPHPDPHHLILKDQEDSFEGRLWFQLKTDQSKLSINYLPHFPIRAQKFVGLRAIPHASKTKIYRDPWHDHPMKYALWAAATAVAIGKNLTGNGSIGSGTFEDLANMESFESFNLDKIGGDFFSAESLTKNLFSAEDLLKDNVEGFLSEKLAPQEKKGE
jgi:hypothetical protein